MSDRCDFRRHMIADMTTRTFRDKARRSVTISDISRPLPAPRSLGRHRNWRRHPSLPFAEVEQRAQPSEENSQASALGLAVCIDAKTAAALPLLPAPMSGFKWKPMSDHRQTMTSQSTPGAQPR